MYVFCGLSVVVHLNIQLLYLETISFCLIVINLELLYIIVCHTMSYWGLLCQWQTCNLSLSAKQVWPEVNRRWVAWGLGGEWNKVAWWNLSFCSIALYRGSFGSICVIDLSFYYSMMVHLVSPHLFPSLAMGFHVVSWMFLKQQQPLKIELDGFWTSSWLNVLCIMDK